MATPKTSGEIPIDSSRAADPGARAPFGERWFPFLSCCAGLLCLLIVFRQFFLSHFDRILSDPGDGRLCIAILEHWYRVFEGKAQAASPNFFFPERGVLGYSDTLFLDALPYATLRFLGLDRYLTFQCTMMLVTAVGFAAMLGLLRRLLRPDPWLQIGGASLFTVSNIYYIQIVHPQLASVAFVPLGCLLALEYWRARNRGLARLYIAAFGILAALLLFTSFYVGWFALLLAAAVCLFLAVCSLLSEGSTWPLRRGVQLLWMRKPDFLLGLGAFALALVPFFAVYLPALGRTKGRSLGDALYFMPGLWSGVDAGRGNLVWGWLARRIEDLWTPGGMIEYPEGWPIFTACIFAASAAYFISRWYRTRHAPYSREKQRLAWLSATSLACIALWLASVTVRGSITGWAVVRWLIPGASAIRVPQRISLVINVGVVLVCVAGVKAFLEAQTGRGWRIRLVAVLLPLTLLAEQMNSMPTHIINRPAELERFARIAPPPAGCSSFFISSEGLEEVNPLMTQTDAMLIAQEFDIPTLNGYSGWFPKGWSLFQAVNDGGNAAVHWATSKGVNRGLCRLDFDNGRWSPVDLQESTASHALSSKSIIGLIKNAGFEDSDLSPWSTYRSVEIGLSSATAHTGTYSLTETSGEGSVYQDVTGLQPGRVYAITAWVAASRDATATAQIAVFDPGKNVATYSLAVSPDSVWQQIEDAVIVGPGGNLRIHLFRNQGTGVIYWDDVSVHALK